MTAQPIERTAALRRENRRTRPADAAHSPALTALGVPVPLAAALTAAGIDAPFPIQAAVVPDARPAPTSSAGARRRTAKPRLHLIACI